MSTSTPQFSSVTQDRQSLRKEIRAKRQALSDWQQRRASENLLSQIKLSTHLYRAKHVALYLANDGEISPAPILELLTAVGAKCYLPVLHPMAHNRLLFCEYQTDKQLVKNKYGIAEPSLKNCRLIQPNQLSAVLLPLVAFDPLGNRMGMGGGYYDRTFAFKQNKPKSTPKLIGLAHECQKVERLPTESWDIPLHSIITDKDIYSANRTK